jgi:hypothetical protein
MTVYGQYIEVEQDDTRFRFWHLKLWHWVHNHTREWLIQKDPSHVHSSMKRFLQHYNVKIKKNIILYVFIFHICHCNIIWTEAKLRSIYYFVGDRPVHKLPFGPKCHELFVILYSIHANLSDHMFLLLYIKKRRRINQWERGWG